jgi:Tol biopolymer transport system component
VLDLRTGQKTYIAPGMDPTWSPTGDTLAFAWDGALRGVAITGGATFVIADNTDCLNPSWSPSGARIAYDKGNSVDGGIWIVGADGSNRTAVGSPAFYGGQNPSWSPKELGLACSGYAPGATHSDLFILPSDSTGARRLTRDRDESEPAWSPNDKTIACTHRSQSIIPEIDLLSLPSGDLQLLIVNGSHPAWSPRGDSIAFEREEPLSRNRGRRSIWITSRTGTGTRRLTTSDSVSVPLPRLRALL